jgi:hypothetical protein
MLSHTVHNAELLLSRIVFFQREREEVDSVFQGVIITMGCGIPAGRWRQKMMGTMDRGLHVVPKLTPSS